MSFDLFVLGRTPEAWLVATAARKCGQRVLLACGASAAFPEDWPAAQLLVRARQAWQSREPSAVPFRPSDLLEPAICDLRREHELRIRRWLAAGGECLAEEVHLDEYAAGLRLRGNCPGQEFFARRAWIATGTSPQRPDWAQFDSRAVLAPTDALTQSSIPRSAVVVGAGSTGLETARFLAALGTRVLLIDRTRPLLDGSLAGGERLEKLLLREGIGWMPHSEVISVVPHSEGGAAVQLVTGEVLRTQTAWLAVESRGQIEGLHLASGALVTDERGRLWCDAQLQTSHPLLRVAGTLAAWHEELASDPGLLRQRVWEESHSPALEPALATGS
ncbi:MAG: FAD-dependent oxidoreductase [Planctomycetaceae bacterium]